MSVLPFLKHWDAIASKSSIESGPGLKAEGGDGKDRVENIRPMSGSSTLLFSGYVCFMFHECACMKPGRHGL